MEKISITGASLMSIQGNCKEEHLANFNHSEKFEDDFDRKYWDKYFEGKSGRIPLFDPKMFLKNHKSTKFMSRETVIGCVAASQALKDSAFDETEFYNQEFQNALIFGAGVSDSIFPLMPAIIKCIDDCGKMNYQEFGDKGFRNLPPLWILTKLPNTTTGQIAVQNQIRGLSYTMVGGPLNGVTALTQSFELLRNSNINCAICGAAESYTHADYISVLADKGVVSLSDNGLLPFDNSSDGCYLTEGASVFILEKNKYAIKRGARFYAHVLSYCNCYIPYLSEGNTDYVASRIENCMRTAIAKSGFSENDIDFIQANAYGHKKLDSAEAIAISNIFGNNILITSCASYTGYAIGAYGAISVAFAIMQMENNRILPIKRTKKFILEDKLNYVRNMHTHRGIMAVLVNAFSFTGDACSIILMRGEI